MSVKSKIFKEIDGTSGEKIVLLDWGEQSPKFVNMQKIDSEGTVLWTATPDHPLEGVWTDVKFEGSILTAYNAAGYSDTIDYRTGRILRRVFVK
jgi:hypothetical protein